MSSMLISLWNTKTFLVFEALTSVLSFNFATSQFRNQFNLAIKFKRHPLQQVACNTFEVRSCEGILSSSDVSLEVNAGPDVSCSYFSRLRCSALLLLDSGNSCVIIDIFGKIGVVLLFLQSKEVSVGEIQLGRGVVFFSLKCRLCVSMSLQAAIIQMCSGTAVR